MKPLTSISDIPILGRSTNADAIKAVEGVLAHLKSGALVNVALVAEQRDGEVFMAMAPSSPAASELVKLRGGLMTLGTAIDLQVLGK